MRRKNDGNLKPKTITENAWWYEDKGGIVVVHQPEPITATLRLPWSVILKAAKRCGKR